MKSATLDTRPAPGRLRTADIMEAGKARVSTGITGEVVAALTRADG